ATAMATASRTTGGGKKGSRTGLTVGVVTALIVAVGSGTFLSRKAETPGAATAKPETAPVPPPPKPPTCADGMVLVSEGKFFMGSDDKTDLPFERPAHQVSLAPFCIDKYEVTTARYKACSDKGECKRASLVNEWEGIKDSERKTFDPLCNARDPEQRGEHPINCIDWEMASQFCHAASPNGRLPTEAEWEFATRGRDGRRFPWGDEWPDAKHLNACDAECMAWGKKNHVEEHAMYEASDGFATTAPVGSFPAGASPFGLQDVVGNVWEWTSDWYAPYTASALTDPKGPDAEVDGQGRVIRGGAWNGAYPAWVRPTFRYHDAPDKRSYGIGFRCAATL
ncbi:MAG TPA: SUMF1/EgtB/PvdO family nonheme iron enzyme, partial [Polyangiaceae bacterium]